MNHEIYFIKLAAKAAEIAGCKSISLVMPKEWRPPKGFVRGELLCINSDGDRVRSYDVDRLIKWLDKI